MARREARKHLRDDDESTDEGVDSPDPEPRVAAPAEASRPNRPPFRLMLGIAALGATLIVAFFWTRGSDGATTTPALVDKNHDTHAALVGAWQCSQDTGGFRLDEMLVLLDGGRYTRKLSASKPGDLWMNLEERSGSWQVVGDQVLITVDSCAKYDATDTKLCLPNHRLTYKLELPVSDEIKIAESCTALKRVGKPYGS